MSRSFDKTKRQELLAQRASLIEEYRAASRQWRETIGEPERLRISRALATIDDQIFQVEADLNKITASLVDQQQDEIEVPVAVIAMNRSEAKTLETPADQDAFHQLSHALHTHAACSLSDCYDELRDDWKPLLADSQKSIASIIAEVTERLNTANTGQPGQPVVRTRSLTEEFFSEDEVIRNQVWDDMDKNGGVIIIDAISMYHDTIRKHLTDCNLFNTTNSVGVVVLSPYKSAAITINKVLRDQVYKGHLPRPFNFFSNHWNPLYEFGVADIDNLRRWLFTALPRVRRTSLSLEVRAAIQSQVGSVPQGIGSVVTGSWSP